MPSLEQLESTRSPESLSFVDAFREKLSVSGTSAAACKDLLNSTEQTLHGAFQKGVDVDLLVMGRAFLIDTVLRHLWRLQNGSDKQPACLVAVGG